MSGAQSPVFVSASTIALRAQLCSNGTSKLAPASHARNQSQDAQAKISGTLTFVDASVRAKSANMKPSSGFHTLNAIASAVLLNLIAQACLF